MRGEGRSEPQCAEDTPHLRCGDATSGQEKRCAVCPLGASRRLLGASRSQRSAHPNASVVLVRVSEAPSYLAQLTMVPLARKAAGHLMRALILGGPRNQGNSTLRRAVHTRRDCWEGMVSAASS